MWITVIFCTLGLFGLVLGLALPSVLPERVRSWLFDELCDRYEERSLLISSLRYGWILPSIIVAFVLAVLVQALNLPAPKLAYSGGLLFFGSLIFSLQKDFNLVTRAGHIMPLYSAIEAFQWDPTWEEPTYRSKLLEHLHDSLGVRQKGEYPVYGSTRVDLWVCFRDVEWYISIKRKLDNQKRLILQGELDDIIAHVRSQRLKRCGIILIVGVMDVRPGEQQTHIDNLLERVDERLNTERVESRGRRRHALWLVQVPISVEMEAIGIGSDGDEGYITVWGGQSNGLGL